MMALDSSFSQPPKLCDFNSQERSTLAPLLAWTPELLDKCLVNEKKTA